MTTFTASEVVAKLRERFASGNAVPVPDVRLTRAEFDAFADLLEAQEKAVPVMVVNHVSSAEHDLPIGMKLYTHPSPSDAERLAETLRECLADYSHPSFTDRHGMADRIRQALALHSAQAQPPAASVTDAMVDAALTRAVIASKESGIKGPTRYMMRAALEAALAAQENPNG